jgi:hypothetical protein
MEPKYRMIMDNELKNIMMCKSVAGQLLSKHIPATTNTQATSFAIQLAVDITIEEEVFSMWFAYIHCGQRMCFLWVRLETV